MKQDLINKLEAKKRQCDILLVAVKLGRVEIKTVDKPMTVKQQWQFEKIPDSDRVIYRCVK